MADRKSAGGADCWRVLRPSHLGLVAVALLSVAGCGGSLSPPDGGGGTSGTTGAGDTTGIGGTTGSGGITGIDGSITIRDASLDVVSCLDLLDQPAPPVPDTPCRYQIPPPPCDYVSASNIGVRVNGIEIPRDTTHTNGWDYTDATFTTVDIYGAACDSLRNVTIVYRFILI